jgi:hypothetical protein
MLVLLIESIKKYAAKMGSGAIMYIQDIKTDSNIWRLLGGYTYNT